MFWMLRFRMSRALSRKRACVPVVRVTVKRTAPKLGILPPVPCPVRGACLMRRLDTMYMLEMVLTTFELFEQALSATRVLRVREAPAPPSKLWFFGCKT